MKDLYRVDGKIAVVTGAATGIGRAIAMRLADIGASVIIADLNLEAAQATVKQLPCDSAAGQEHAAVYIDVTNEKSVKEVYEAIGQKHGHIDIAVNNAGVSSMNVLEELTEKDWDFNMDVNAKGVFLCTKHEVPWMKELGGVMVNTASMAYLYSAPLLAHYTASKFAVAGWSQTAAKELAKYGIRVNYICPGYVFTDMQNREVVWEGKLRGMTGEEVRDDYVQQTPLGRLCQPEDVANAVGFLVSPQASFITGAAIPITGGAEL